MRKAKPGPYGMLAEFALPGEVLEAARRAHAQGYTRMDAFTPYPIEELSEAIGMRKTRLPFIVLIGGILGGLGGYLMQYFLNGVDYPLNVGGRPLQSWPAFIPITFECTVLLAALSAVFGMLALNGLPQPYHPVFNAPNFALASRDHFFLLIEARDPRFDAEQTASFLNSLGAREVIEVEP